MIDSLPVIGPGSKIVVNIGDSGEVVGLIHRWREVQEGKRREIEPAGIITLEQATEMAKRQIAAEYGEKTSFKINTVSKAYFDNNGSILQPVYAFETTINLNEGDKKYPAIQLFMCHTDFKEFSRTTSTYYGRFKSKGINKRDK